MSEENKSRVFKRRKSPAVLMLLVVLLFFAAPFTKEKPAAIMAGSVVTCHCLRLTLLLLLYHDSRSSALRASKNKCGHDQRAKKKQYGRPRTSKWVVVLL